MEGLGSVTQLSVIGLGRLGLCAAACFASRGVPVVGVDINPSIVDAVNRGAAPFYEPQLPATLRAAGDRLEATADYGRALERSDVTLLIVPTPSGPDGEFSDAYLQDALTHLARALRVSRKPSHLFVITSTVSPGTIEGRLIPLIESVSGRALHEGFEICYNPEFIALGTVISDFLRPDLVLIGESAGAAGDRLEALYRSVCENTPRVARMSIVSAEITKIALNSFVTTKITFANTLASICEAVPGADIDAITDALGADRRVSPHYLRGGLPFGGPCFPRDNRAFAVFAARHGVDARLAKATEAANLARVREIAGLVRRHVPQADRRVAVLGLSFKAGTPVIEESPGMLLVEELLAAGDVEVAVYDPLAAAGARAQLGDRVRYATSTRDCMDGAALCVFTTAASEFREVDDTFLTRTPATVIDCWRVLDPAKFGPAVRYVALGRAG